MLGFGLAALAWLVAPVQRQVIGLPPAAELMAFASGAGPSLPAPLLVTPQQGANGGITYRHPKLTTVLAAVASAVPQDFGAGAAAPMVWQSLPLPKPVLDAAAARQLRVNANGEAQVYLLVDQVNEANLGAVTLAGASVELQDSNRRVIQARVPVSRLVAVADLPFVHFIRLPNYAVHFTGSVDTQGDSILKADQVRSQLHVDGTGVKVGVISDGLKGVFATGCTTCQGAAGGPIATGDLPTSTGTRNASGVLTASSGGITGQSFSANSDLEGLPSGPCGFAGAGAEGTALLEIVHDIAPGAQLYFANFDTDLAFNNAVNSLAGQTDVVMDDIGFFGFPTDGASPVSSNTAGALNSSTNAIRAYLTAVGNEAADHYNGNYTHSGVDGASIVGASGDLHLFQAASGTTDVLNLGPSYKEKILLPSGGEVVVVLTWNDPFGASSNNYDLYLIDEATGGVAASSTDPQNGTQDPVEFIDYTNSTGAQGFFDIVVQNVGNQAAVRTLDLFAFQPECGFGGPIPVTSGTNLLMNYNTAAGSLTAESDAGGTPVSVISVGAIGAQDAPNFQDIEYYSSNGPTQDGRTKPDVTGIDGVAVTGAGSFENPFYGTSAATPHGAGIAALLLQSAPCLLNGSTSPRTNTDARTILRGLLLNNADLRGSTVPNNIFGYGLLNALASALQTVPAAGTAPPITLGANTPTGATATLPTSGFTDPDQCPLNVTATGGCTTSTGTNPTVTCPFGTTAVTLVASNNGVTFTSAVPAQITVTRFVLGATSTTGAVAPGQTATYPLTVTPQLGAYSNTVTLACSNLPSESTCAFSPSSVAPGSNPVNVSMTVSTTAASLAAPFRMGAPPWKYLRLPGAPLSWPARLLAALALLAGLASFAARRRSRRATLLLGTALALAALQFACGGGSSSGGTVGNPGTPAGTYNVTVTGSSGTYTSTQQVTLTVQ